MAAKKISGYIKLQLPAGKANPSPPVGPALGQHGVNIMQFCKDFNARSAPLGDTILPVVITVYADRSYSFVMKSPPASVMLKDLVKAEKGSGEPNKTKIGKITLADCKKIAKEKEKDLNCFDLDHGARIIAGQARSMGITVEG